MNNDTNRNFKSRIMDDNAHDKNEEEQRTQIQLTGNQTNLEECKESGEK